MTKYNIPSVTIDLESFPPAGASGISTKLRKRDRDLIAKAADLLDMKQSDFMRMTMINAAKAIVTQCEALGESYAGFVSG